MTTFTVLAGGAAVATGMTAGVLYAFSAFVIAGLRTLPHDHAGQAMRGINVHAQRPPLMLLMLASVTLPLAAAITGGTQREDGVPWAIAGAAVAVTGVFAITVVRNVPLNERLRRAGTAGPAWERYVRPWLWWNHARTALTATASAMFVIAA